MKKITIQKITQNSRNFWTVNLIMRAEKLLTGRQIFRYAVPARLVPSQKITGRLAVVCAAATITSRTCAQSKMVPFRSGCFYYQMADGHNLRCFCNDRDFCNGAPRRPATTLLGVLSAAAFAATFRLLAIWQRRLYVGSQWRSVVPVDFCRHLVSENPEKCLSLWCRLDTLCW